MIKTGVFAVWFILSATSSFAAMVLNSASILVDVSVAVKISYSCIRNVHQILKSHNSNTMFKNAQANDQKLCNCRQKNACPLRGKCLVKDVVYMAKVHVDQNVACYVGLASGSFVKVS